VHGLFQLLKNKCPCTELFRYIPSLLSPCSLLLILIKSYLHQFAYFSNITYLLILPLNTNLHSAGPLQRLSSNFHNHIVHLPSITLLYLIFYIHMQDYLSAFFTILKTLSFLLCVPSVNSRKSIYCTTWQPN
jgi:hypothetical protein